MIETQTREASIKAWRIKEKAFQESFQNENILKMFFRQTKKKKMLLQTDSHYRNSEENNVRREGIQD